MSLVSWFELSKNECEVKSSFIWLKLDDEFGPLLGIGRDDFGGRG